MKIEHGTPAWFEMVGDLMTRAALDAELAPDLHLSLVERYLDGVEWAPGWVQGLRFEIAGGQPVFKGAGSEVHYYDFDGRRFIQIPSAH